MFLLINYPQKNNFDYIIIIMNDLNTSKEKSFGKMLLTTRLAGVTFGNRQAILEDLRNQGDAVNHTLRHHNHYQGQDGIAIFQGSADLGWIPKEIAKDLLLPEISASTIKIDSIELTEIVGGTELKENYGAEIVIFLSGDSHTLDVLAESIKALHRKATEAFVMDGSANFSKELKHSKAHKIKQTKIDNNNKLLIIGSSQLKSNDIRKVLHEYGIQKDQYKVDNDYYALKNTEDLSSHYKYIFFGPMPHSGKGMGEDSNIIAHYQQNPKFIVTEIQNTKGQLKITAEGLREALNKLA
jgi:hypothetical protein